MQESVERLAASLLYEGYALYPYTPGATKNATPTPFGIVYPPAYAAAQPAAFDHLQVECVALGIDRPEEVGLEVALLFLQAAGSRHAAAERRLEASTTLSALATEPLARSFAFEPSSELGVATGAELDAAHEVLSGSFTVSAEPLGGGMLRIKARVENTTPLPADEAEQMDRGSALRRSLLSTHVMAGLARGRFASPLETDGEVGAAVQACENVNCWPVLAAADDDAVLAADVVLPDHPRIAAQSRANMFDNTEIEEALTLHIQTLSEAEREAIAEQDPAVREMIERVETTSPEQLREMHGEMKPVQASEPRFPEWREPEPGGSPARRSPPPGFEDEAVPGESEVLVEGRPFRRGDRVVLRPGTGGDPYDKMLHGRSATVHRIFLDYDGRAYLGVTVDDDPMAEVLEGSGRYLFFFADEIEPHAAHASESPTRAR